MSFDDHPTWQTWHHPLPSGINIFSNYTCKNIMKTATKKKLKPKPKHFQINRSSSSYIISSALSCDAMHAFRLYQFVNILLQEYEKNESFFSLTSLIEHSSGPVKDSAITELDISPNGYQNMEVDDFSRNGTKLNFHPNCACQRANRRACMRLYIQFHFQI